MTRLCPPNPFGLSLSKPSSSLRGSKEREAFDKLRPNGCG
jgi:hypothetical protein